MATANQPEIPAAGAWAAKARALDRYRWLLLRGRHSLVGSGLRFAREALRDWLFGLGARVRLARSYATEPCDFLLLQSAVKIIAMQRKKLLIEGLLRDHSLVETALPEHSAIVQRRMLKLPPQWVPLRYFGYAAHAEWLVARYEPKVLLNDRNGSLYAPFLRLSLNVRQKLLVQLAHATTAESSRRLGMNDYDYYFLFGQSSVEALQARALRFGTSQVVLAGSHMIDMAFDLPPADPALRSMLVLGVGPDKEKEHGYQRTYAILRDWAKRNPDYRLLIKAHPRSRVPFWSEAATALTNVKVLPATCGLAEALEQASLVVNIMSNAVIEAALARRPVLYVNASGEPDIFAQERFLGSCISDLDGLQQAVVQVELNRDHAIRQGTLFAEHHLAHGCQGLAWSIQALSALLGNRPPPGVSVILTSTIEQ